MPQLEELVGGGPSGEGETPGFEGATGMTVEEMISVVHDVIDAAIMFAPPGLSDSQLDEFVVEGDFAIRHVHDGPRRVSVFAGSTLLFKCSPAQWRKVMDSLDG